MHKKFLLEKLEEYLLFVKKTYHNSADSYSSSSSSFSSSSSSSSPVLQYSARDISLPLVWSKPTKASFYPTPTTFSAFYGQKYYLKESDAYS